MRGDRKTIEQFAWDFSTIAKAANKRLSGLGDLLEHLVSIVPEGPQRQAVTLVRERYADFMKAWVAAQRELGGPDDSR